MSSNLVQHIISEAQKVRTFKALIFTGILTNEEEEEIVRELRAKLNTTVRIRQGTGNQKGKITVYL